MKPHFIGATYELTQQNMQHLIQQLDQALEAFAQAQQRELELEARLLISGEAFMIIRREYDKYIENTNKIVMDQQAEMKVLEDKNKMAKEMISAYIDRCQELLIELESK